MEKKETLEDRGMTINVKNWVIKVALGNEMDGITIMTKVTKSTRYPTAVKTVKNRFLCNPTAKNTTSHGQSPERKSDNSNSSQTSQASENYTSLLKDSYTQIMVNHTQLNEHEFTNWMEKLMEAWTNRQERKECPYRSYRKPYNATEQGTRHPQLRNRLCPAQELDVHNIMTAYNCKYDDVVEAVDLYNLDVEDS